VLVSDADCLVSFVTPMLKLTSSVLAYVLLIFNYASRSSKLFQYLFTLTFPTFCQTAISVLAFCYRLFFPYACALKFGTYESQLSPQSRTLLLKLLVSQLVKKFPPCYGARGVVTIFRSARHLSLSWATWIKITPSCSI